MKPALWFGMVLAALLVPAAAAEPAVPEWAADAVWYQIYPERFRNGDASNDPTPEEVERPPDWRISPWTNDWYRLQEWERNRGGFYGNVNHRRYGGDLQGIIDKLDYLTNLGITAIYLNPVFEAFSHHKYDGSSFHHVDNNFGPDAAGDLQMMAGEDFAAAAWSWSAADRLFLDLIQQARRRNIRVIIDGVFNHVGTRFPPFQDVVKNQQQSRYAGWFDIRRWDDPGTPENEFDYKGWWNIKSLPEFREDPQGLVPGPREYVFAVTRRWMDPNGDGDPADGVDGWRLDVANEVAPPFWREWRKLVKSINPRALIIGEIWDDASQWLQGDQFDSVMNYRFAKAAVRFFIDQADRRFKVSEFDNELRAVRQSYPERVNHALLNLFDSHDTDRFASMIKNPDREYDRKAGPTTNPQYDVTRPGPHERRVQKLMVLFQMTYLGAPMVYYGSEAGMWGADDPDDRKPMVWSGLQYEPERAHPLGLPRTADQVAFEPELFEWYRTLIRIRKEEAPLRQGSIQTLFIDDSKGIYAFKRSLGTNSIVVVLNNHTEAQTPALRLPMAHRDLLTGKIFFEEGKGGIRLDGKTGVILKPQGG